MQFVVAQVGLFADFLEAVVVGAGHKHIDVVVPRYHAVMANGTNSRPATAVIGDMVLLADGYQFLQHIQDDGIPARLQFRSNFLHK